MIIIRLDIVLNVLEEVLYLGVIYKNRRTYISESFDGGCQNFHESLESAKLMHNQLENSGTLLIAPKL